MAMSVEIKGNKLCIEIDLENRHHQHPAKPWWLLALVEMPSLLLRWMANLLLSG